MKNKGPRQGEHDGHQLVMIAEDVTVRYPVALTEDGDVVDLDQPVEIISWDNSTSHVECKDCGVAIQAGENGLAEDWQFL